MNFLRAMMLPFWLLAWSVSLAPGPATAKAAKPFTLFYSMSFTQSVSGFEQCGLVRIPIVHASAFFKNGVQGSMPDYNQIEKVGTAQVEAAAKTAHKLVVVDVEGSWSLGPTESRDVMAGKAADYYDLLNFLKTQLRARKSGARLGYFEVAPPSFYQNPSQPGQPKTSYEEAVAALDVVARNSDALFPQLYGYGGPEHFKKYTIGTVGTARKYWPTKPVYPFIWMQRRVDPKTPGGAYTHELIPTGAFRIQLDTVKASGADGVVIWGTLGDTQRRLDWNGKAAWWLETKAFLVRQGVDMKNCKL